MAFQQKHLHVVWFCLLGLTGIINLVSCDEEGEETLISRNFSTESHRAGEDCLFCHQPNYDADGWFRVAGTVYEANGLDPAPNGVVRFFRQPGGAEDLVMRLEVDGKGNFYTTEPLEFDDGLEVEVENTTGDVFRMQGLVTTGACNTCHDGQQTDRIRSSFLRPLSGEVHGSGLPSALY